MLLECVSDVMGLLNLLGGKGDNKLVGDWNFAVGDVNFAVGDWNFAVGDWNFAVG